MLTADKIKFFNSMFLECSSDEIPAFAPNEIESLINKILSLFDKKNITKEEFLNSIHKIFQDEIKIYDSFFTFSDTPEKKAKRNMLQAWRDELFCALECKKNEKIILEDVNRVLYDTAQCLNFGIHPKAYRLICLSTIRESLDNKQWILHIDGLAFIDKNKKEKPSIEERYSFLKDNIAPIETDRDLEEHLNSESFPFTLHYDRIKTFISENNIFNSRKLSPIQKITFESIFLSSAQKVHLLINETFQNKSEDWIDLFPNISEKLKLTKNTSHIFEQVYAELFSKTEDLHEIAESARKQIENITSEKVPLTEIQTGLEGFFERASQIINEVGDKIDSGNNHFNELIENTIEHFPTAVQQVANNVIDSIYKPEPFFVVNPEIFKYLGLPIHSLNETDQHSLTVSLAKQLARLKADLMERVHEIPTLNELEYQIFKNSFEKELIAFSLNEKEVSKKEALENLNLHLSFALPFFLLKDILSKDLSDEGKVRVTELFTLLKQYTAKAWRQWSSKSPTVSEIEHLVRQAQNFSTYLSSDFQQKLNDLEEYIEISKPERSKNEKEIKEPYFQIETISHSDVEDKSNEEDLSECQNQDNDKIEEHSISEEIILQEINAIESYRTVTYLAMEDNVWKCAEFFINDESSSLKEEYVKQIVEIEQKKLKEIEEAQNKLEEDKLYKELENRDKELIQYRKGLWSTEKIKYVKLIDDEIKRLNKFSLFADDLITHLRVEAFEHLRAKLEESGTINNFYSLLTKFETNTFILYDDKKYGVLELLQTNRFGRHEFSENTLSNVFYKSLKEKVKAQQPALYEKAMTAHIADMNFRLNSEACPIVRRSFIQKIQEFMQKIVLIGRYAMDVNSKKDQEKFSEKIENNSQVPVTIQKEESIKEERLNLYDDKAVAAYLTKELNEFNKNQPNWFNDNRKTVPKKNKDMISAFKDFIGVEDTETQIAKKHQLLSSCTERKIKAIAKISKEIKKIDQKKYSENVNILLNFMKDLGIEWDFKNKPQFLPTLINDNVTVTSVSNERFGKPGDIPMKKDYYNLGTTKGTTFFSKPPLQNFVINLPKEVGEQFRTYHEDTMKVSNFLS